MKLVIEITGYDHGKYESDGENSSWARLTGKNSSGAYCRAVYFGSTAEAIVRDLGRHIPKGEEIGTTRLVVELTGEWRDSKKEFTRPDGSKGRYRSFYGTTYDILTGPNLELARIRRDGADRLELAEQHRKEGRMDLAYKTVAEYLALVSNRPFDPSGLEEIIAADEAEFGAPAAIPDPEAEAAASFASIDGKSEPMAIAPEQQISSLMIADSEKTAEEVTTAAAADGGDVLDDEPASPSPAKVAPAAPVASASRPAAPRPAPARPAAASPAPAPAKPAPAPATAAPAARPVPPRPGAIRIPRPPRLGM